MPPARSLVRARPPGNKHRDEVERTVNLLKTFRAVATRYDERAPSGPVVVAESRRLTAEG